VALGALGVDHGFDRPSGGAIEEEEIEMRKIVAGLFVSLDGVVEAPERWTFPYFDDEVGQAIGGQMAASDTLLLGRRTYEGFAAYWPEQSAEDDPMAGFMNDVPKLVVSTTLRSVEWKNSTLIDDDVAERLAEEKRRPGKDIAISGSGTLVGSLLRDGLLDELRLLVYPVVVGAGKRLLEEGGAEVPMKLVESRAFGSGVVSLAYEPASGGPPAA
jgi:dihydrofolate reductase